MPVTLLDDVRPDESEHPFLPGMVHGWLMPWYDVVARFRGLGRLYRRTAETADVRGGQHVLDVGCGTGNLGREVLRRTPDAVLTGLDPDGGSLRRAARKLRRQADVTLVRGFAHRLPVPDAGQDRVVSSLALHHVPLEEKQQLAAELVRVLRPGGTVTIADFADDHHAHRHGASSSDTTSPDDAPDHEHEHRHDHRDHSNGHGRAKDGGHRHRGTVRMHGADNADGGIERLLTDAGLVDARTVGRMTVLGSEVVLVQARRA